MVIDEVSAWILHKKNVGENSAYITFFTSRLGLISALCRGCTSPSKQSMLQQFSPLWVSLQKKSDNFYVNKIELQSASLNFTMDSLFAGLYVNELLYYLLQPLDAHESLFTHYVNTINALQYLPNKISLAALLRKFELNLLDAIGYGINLTYDFQKALPIDSNCYYQYYPDRGFLEQEHGIQGKYLLAIAADDFLDTHTLKYAKIITRCALDLCLAGRELKSRYLYS